MKRALALALAGLLVGCPAKKSPESQPPTAGPRFVDRAAASGLNYRWQFVGKRPGTILQTIGHGAAFVDFDRDGNLDVFLVGAKPGLFRGDGKGAFADVTEVVLGGLAGHFLGVAVGDFDNDGFDDLYVSGYREGRLLKNEAGKRLRDVTKASGIPAQPWGTSASWTDLDGDGWLDLVVLNYLDFGPMTQPQLCSFPADDGQKLPSACGPRHYSGRAGVLFRNRGGGRFVDATRAWNFRHAGKGLGVTSLDFEGSGRPGLAIANDEAEGNLFIGLGGGKLRDIAVEAGTARDRDGNLHAGMGIDGGDFDNDGKVDVILTTFRNEAKSLYRNLGERLFEDVAYPAGIGRTAFSLVAFGVKFLDADNDGWLDILMASGHIQDNVERLENTTYRQPLLFLRNRGASGKALFDDGTKDCGLAGTQAVGRGVATGDYDNDGKVDALVVDSEGAPLLLHNETSGANHWLSLRLESVHGGRSAYGAQVRLTLPDGKTLLRHCQSDGSYLCASDSRVHVGLGPATEVDVTVRWPGGKTATFGKLTADRRWRLSEKDGRAHEERSRP